ncbi:MAG: flagellar biosynthesis anti-sigma factor FlgM [Clostridiales bacterium GWB2_37_7]|nr:MAG: flagellar biosynthesis anti-sigma factor FlgM [Clostridiales bacterium GWB2_37_7]
MGIGFNKIGGVNQVYKVNKVEAKKSVNEAASVSSKKDQVQISKEAMDFQTVLKSVKQLNNLPDIREEVINPIKEKMDNGTYKVDSKSIAEKILLGGFNKKI